MKPNKMIIMREKSKPNSSAIKAKIKSLYDSGRYSNFCTLEPKPNPKIPPFPNASSDAINWYPLPVGSSQGFKKETILFNLYGWKMIKGIDIITANNK